jgi:hypothetical protein
MKTRYILLLLYLIFNSCQGKKEVDYSIQIESLNFNKLVEWDGLNSNFITISFLFINKSNRDLFINKDSLNFQLIFPKHKIDLNIRDISILNNAIKPNDSLIFETIMSESRYGKNLQQMLNRNIKKFESDFLITYRNLIKNNVSLEKKIKKPRKIHLKMFLDTKEINLSDSIGMNYHYKVPPPPTKQNHDKKVPKLELCDR